MGLGMLGVRLIGFGAVGAITAGAAGLGTPPAFEPESFALAVPGYLGFSGNVDINGDGLLESLYRSSLDSSPFALGVLRRTPGGGLTRVGPFAHDSSFGLFALLDLNNDGRQDCYVGYTPGSGLIVYRIDLESGMIPLTALPFTDQFPSLRTAIQNGSLGYELLVGVGSPPAYSMLGATQDGGAAFTPRPEFHEIHSFLRQVADLNGDGVSEVLGVDATGTELLVYLSSGPGVWEEPVRNLLPPSIPDEFRSNLQVVDLDADGLQDVLLSRQWLNADFSWQFRFEMLRGVGGGVMEQEGPAFERTVGNNQRVGAILGPVVDGRPTIILETRPWTGPGVEYSYELVRLDDDAGFVSTPLPDSFGRYDRAAGTLSSTPAVLGFRANDDDPARGDYTIATFVGGSIEVSTIAADLPTPYSPTNGGRLSFLDWNGNGLWDGIRYSLDRLLVHENVGTPDAPVFLDPPAQPFRQIIAVEAVGAADGPGAELLVAGTRDETGEQVVAFVRTGPRESVEIVASVALPGPASALALIPDAGHDGLRLAVSYTLPQSERIRVMSYAQADGFTVLDDFESPAVGIRGMAAADLDGDGLPDLVVAVPGFDVARVFWGEPGGGFGDPVSANGFPSSLGRRVHLTDLNDDGTADLIVECFNGQRVRSWIVGPDRSITPAGVASLAGVRDARVVVGDFNGDGIPDVAIPSGLRYGIAHGDGMGGFGPVTPVSVDGTIASMLPVASGDGPDRLMVALSNHTVRLLQADGTGVDGHVYATSAYPTWLQLADLDGDGAPELISADTRGPLTILRGLPPPCPADINGDGQLNFFDFAAFIALFNAGDPAADFNGDGVLNFFDFAAFVGAFNAGCP
ncbi:MAG: FG-GAP-like repeat-containing protein [Phycisphaerales bacterium]|nr:VCBS repeat-containing protein [Planctomycetota bacterium]MCH8509264.1 FG-GAP-like repeat-containing protein [Phycisphaerales bacterium]